MWWSYSGLIKMNQESLKWAWRYLTSSRDNENDHFKRQELNYFLYVVFCLLEPEWKFSCSGTALATAVAEKWFILRVTAVVNLLTPTTLKRLCFTVGRSRDGTDLKLLHSEGKRIGRPPNPITWFSVYPIWMKIQSNIIFTGLKAQRQIENSVRFKYLSWTLSCWTLKGELEPARLWEFSNLPQIRRRSESSHKSSFPWMNFFFGK